MTTRIDPASLDRSGPVGPLRVRGDTEVALGHLTQMGLDRVKLNKVRKVLEAGGAQAAQDLAKAMPTIGGTWMAQDLAKRGLARSRRAESDSIRHDKRDRFQ
ncbi:hypothetical protein [Magnetospira sp. QH-2]|uniref:hypothetical protein n=1 Tax=Magnetospira sp. (strain QH-2) TaxID=1288970 RepID=UPI0003E81219|nr:hypothetical protein [Magnetospira sp. QH-2]CCQ72316.1 protein of unknown function [Magnetospira sp. QH-2]